MQKLIDEKEAVRLGKHASFEVLSIAKAIYEMTFSENSNQSNSQWSLIFALTNIFLAGRIQGIREERLKKAEKNNKKEIA